MTKFTHPFQLLAHDKSGVSDCSEKSNTEVVLLDSGTEPPFWCTVQELIQEVRRRARVAERQNGKPQNDEGATTDLAQVEPVEEALND